MRQINQLAQVLVKIMAAVVELKGKGSSQEALEIMNRALLSGLGRNNAPFDILFMTHIPLVSS